MQSAIKQFPGFDLKVSYPPYEIYELKTKNGMGGRILTGCPRMQNSKNKVFILKDF